MLSSSYNCFFAEEDMILLGEGDLMVLEDGWEWEWEWEEEEDIWVWDY